MTRPPRASNAVELLLRLAHGEPVTPDEALRCLVDRDPAVEAIIRRKQRDRALADAAAALGWPGDSGTWTAAATLAKAVHWFEAVHWPRVRAGRPLADLPRVDQCLARAFLLADVPKSARGLYDVLRSQSPETAVDLRQH